MTLKAAYFLLVFLASSGLIVFGFLLSIELNPKFLIVVGSCFICTAILIPLVYQKTISLNGFAVMILAIFLLLSFITYEYFIALLNNKVMVAKSSLIFLIEFFLFAIVAVVLAEYRRWGRFNSFKVIFQMTGFLSALVILKVMLVFNVPFIDLISFFEIKKLTDLGFVNSFSYVCAFGLICGAIAWSRERAIVGTNFRYAISYLIIALLPVLYLLFSKSKGGWGVLILGLAIMFIRRRALVIFAILGGLVLTLVPNQYLCDIFLDLMMYGRNAPPEEVIDKVIAMFTARVGASLFWNDPIAFLINHPLGIGLEMALSMTYEVPGKNIILGNHSLILILLDAYGLLFLVIAALALCYLFYKRSRQAGLGLVMLGLPMLITNEPHIAYAIPLMILMSHKSIVSFNSNRLPLKSLATHDTA